jgi:2-polyprenyl-3-methyl-5-hydroxy-6-metoxy-1,4-benzoquinol methylase
MRSSAMLNRWLIRWGRLGFTDVYHENVSKRGVLGQLYVLFVGTPHLGTYANGVYLRRALAGRAFESILDAGCGDGTFSFYVSSKYPRSRVLGVDIGEQGLHSIESTLDICARVLRILKLPNLEFRQMDLREMDFQEAFDFIYCFDVLEHIAENKLVLAKMYRALKSNGQLLFRIPTRVQERILSKKLTAEHERWAVIEHVGQHYERDSLMADLREIGFKVVSLDYTMGFWGKLSFELSEGMRVYHFPEVIQFGIMPLLKALRFIDTRLRPTNGDGLLALCQRQEK